MRASRKLSIVSAIALFVPVLALPMVAMTQDKPDAAQKAIETRQGYMKVVGWEAGPLFGMAKGNVAYDAEAAKAHASNLNIIAQYPIGDLFMAGTSNADRPGKTRALPKITEDASGFAKATADWQAAIAVLVSEAGKGQEALAAAVGGLGKSCGGCHKPYRAKDF